MRVIVVALLGLLTFGCSGNDLTPAHAEEVLKGSTLLTPADTVTVSAISTSGPAEAIARSTIAGETLNLKMRRFGTDWSWEFVETKTGGWVSPDIAMAGIRETQRRSRAAKWADANRPDYAETAKVMSILGLYLPNPTQGLDRDTWVSDMRRTAAIFREEMPERVAAMTAEHPTDRWGTEFIVRFDSPRNAALILSAGLDRTPDTADDLVWEKNFRRGYEEGRAVWFVDDSVSVPEGLVTVVPLLEFADEPAVHETPLP